MTLNTGICCRQFDSQKKSIAPLHWSLVWAVETTILVHFHKLTWEEQEELLNIFSKTHAVVTTGRSCMTVSVSPERSFWHLQCTCHWQPDRNQILFESSKTNKTRMGKYPNILPVKTLQRLNFYHHRGDYVCESKQNKERKRFVQEYACSFHSRVSPRAMQRTKLW